MSEFLNPKDVNIDQLVKIFKAAYLKPIIDDDGDLRITAHSGMPTFVYLNSEHEFINFAVYMQLNENAKRSDKLALMNKINSSIILTRFYSPDDNAMVADYYILYKEGISSLQILSTIQFYQECIDAAVQNHNDSDIIV